MNTTNEKSSMNSALAALNSAAEAVKLARANSAAYDSSSQGRFVSGCELSVAFAAYEAAYSAYEAALAAK
jgi:hypothetical protein